MAASSSKGSKKGRRFNQPRSAAAVTACAKRKTERRLVQERAHKDNTFQETTPWQEAQAARVAKRTHKQAEYGAKIAANIAAAAKSKREKRQPVSA